MLSGVVGTAFSTAISISAAFDAGNIKVVSTSATKAVLEIKPDPLTELEQKAHACADMYVPEPPYCAYGLRSCVLCVQDSLPPGPHCTYLRRTRTVAPQAHLQWFYFRATASEPGTVRYEIANAGAVSFPLAWEGTQVCVSTDRKVWTRCDATTYDQERGALCWTYAHTASTPSVYFAYFDPYDYERQLDLVARCAAAPGARVRSLGQTLDGRELDCVEVGRGPLHADPNPS